MGSSPSPAPAAASNTVTQVQQIPQYEQQFAQQNMNLAQSLGSQPAPVYNAPIVAGINGDEQAGLSSVMNNAYDYAGYFNQGWGTTVNAQGMNPTAAGDPSQNATYGAGAISAANPIPGTSAIVGGNIGQAEQDANGAYSTASGANNYGTAASNMAQGASNTYGSQAANMATSAAANNMVPGVANQVNNITGQVVSGNPVASTTAAVDALDPANAGVIQKYMNPYVQASLQPQLMQAGITQAQQQAQINSGATSANAFGDARQGTQNALQNYYGQQTNAGIEAQGYNTAYTNAQNAALQQQGQQQQLGTLGVNEQQALTGIANTQVALGGLGVNEQNAQTNAANTVLGAGTLGVNAANTVLGAGTLGVNSANAMTNAANVNVANANAATNFANTGVNEQNMMLNQQTSEQNYQKILQAQQAQQAAIGQQEISDGTQNQTDTLNAANAQYDAGNIEQQNQQSQLTAAYQQYMNQVNWPYAMLGVQESALSNSPYDIAKADTVPAPNSTTAGLSSFASLAGSLGTLGGASK